MPQQIFQKMRTTKVWKEGRRGQDSKHILG